VDEEPNDLLGSSNFNENWEDDGNFDDDLITLKWVNDAEAHILGKCSFMFDKTSRTTTRRKNKAIWKQFQ